MGLHLARIFVDFEICLLPFLIIIFLFSSTLLIIIIIITYSIGFIRSSLTSSYLSSTLITLPHECLTRARVDVINPLPFVVLSLFLLTVPLSMPLSGRGARCKLHV